MRCDVIAEGIVAAAKELGVTVHFSCKACWYQFRAR